jgi:hypothetical protein
MIRPISRSDTGGAVLLATGLLAASAALAQPEGQAAAGAAAAATQSSAAGRASAQPAAGTRHAPSSKSAGPPSHYLPARFAGRAGLYYRYVWGIDSLSVKLMESGELVRFAWRVVDADRAGVLNEKKVAPSLIDPQAGVSLVVPTLDKVGQLRQSAPPEVGKSYWIAFSNKGRIVKRGDHVNVVVGPFHAEGLAVD